MKKTAIFSVIDGFMLVAFTGLTILNHTPENKIKRELSLGQRYMEEGDYDQAILAFEKAADIGERENADADSCAQAYGALADAYDRKTEETIDRDINTANDYSQRADDARDRVDYYLHVIYQPETKPPTSGGGGNKESEDETPPDTDPPIEPEKPELVVPVVQYATPGDLIDQKIVGSRNYISEEISGSYFSDTKANDLNWTLNMDEANTETVLMVDHGQFDNDDKMDYLTVSAVKAGDHFNLLWEMGLDCEKTLDPQEVVTVYETEIANEGIWNTYMDDGFLILTCQEEVASGLSDGIYFPTLPEDKIKSSAIQDYQYIETIQVFDISNDAQQVYSAQRKLGIDGKVDTSSALQAAAIEAYHLDALKTGDFNWENKWNSITCNQSQVVGHIYTLKQEVTQQKQDDSSVQAVFNIDKEVVKGGAVQSGLPFGNPPETDTESKETESDSDTEPICSTPAGLDTNKDDSDKDSKETESKETKEIESGTKKKDSESDSESKETESDKDNGTHDAQPVASEGDAGDGKTPEPPKQPETETKQKTETDSDPETPETEPETPNPQPETPETEPETEVDPDAVATNVITQKWFDRDEYTVNVTNHSSFSTSYIAEGLAQTYMDDFDNDGDDEIVAVVLVDDQAYYVMLENQGGWRESARFKLTGKGEDTLVCISNGAFKMTCDFYINQNGEFVAESYTDYKPWSDKNESKIVACRYDGYSFNEVSSPSTSGSKSAQLVRINRIPDFDTNGEFGEDVSLPMRFELDYY